MNINYSQPDFYHHTEDSTFLANFVFKRVSLSKGATVADFCTGCGVIGIEFANSAKNVDELHFLEGQENFIEHIEVNIEKYLNINTKTKIINHWLSDFKQTNTYDIILCNPPYFQPGAGRASPSMNRQICRTFEQDNFEILIATIRDSLTDKGQAFVIFRSVPKEFQKFEIVYEDDLKKVLLVLKEKLS